MAGRRYSHGIRIEGLGIDASKAEGVCWYEGRRLSAAQKAASDFEWIGGTSSRTGLADLPSGNSGSSIDPFECRVRGAQFNFELHFGDAEGAEFARYPPVASSWLDEDLDHDETSIILSDDFTAADDGTVVWIEDEAILLGAFDTDHFDNCVRGYYGTTAKELSRYVPAYRLNPYVQGRLVTLVRFDHGDDSETLIWRGLIDDFESDKTGVRLVLTVREILAPIQEATVNQGAPEITKALGELNVPTVGSVLSVRDNMLAGNVTLPLGGERVHTKRLTAAHWGAFQVGEGLFFAEWNTAFGVYRFTDADGWHSEPQLGSELPEDDEFNAFEVIAVVRARDVVDGVLVAQADRRSSTALLTYPFHPLSVPMALHMSSSKRTADPTNFDVFGPEWGNDDSPDWWDLDDVRATIERTAHLEIDYLLEGWDGTEVRSWEVLKDACLSWGFFPCPTADGRYTIRELRDATVEDVANAPTVRGRPDTLHWQPRRSDSVDVVSGVLGELPWFEGRPYTNRNVDRRGTVPVATTSRRRGTMAKIKERRRDIRTIASESLLASMTPRLRPVVAAPRLEITADDELFGVGTFVRLESLSARDPWLRDTDGTRVHPSSGDAKWLGLLLGRKQTLERGRADIEMLMTNQDGRFARLRAPSAVISDGSAAPVYAVSPEFSADDAATWKIGNVAEAWSTRGVRRGVRGTVTAIDVDELTFDTDLQAQDGDVIRCAYLGTGGFPEAGNPNHLDGFLAYTYLGGAGVVGESALEAHTYGVG